MIIPQTELFIIGRIIYAKFYPIRAGAHITAL